MATYNGVKLPEFPEERADHKRPLPYAVIGGQALKLTPEQLARYTQKPEMEAGDGEV